MDNGAQASDTIVRVVLLGSTFMLKLGGQAALHVAGFLAAATSDKAKDSGKVRLKTLLQSGSELKVFTLQGEENFRKFALEAKDYGILYSVVNRTDEDLKNDVYDLMVRAEDAGKINRVIEKFHLIEVEGAVTEARPEEIEENRIMDARTLLGKMLERQDQTVNPPEASEGLSQSDASYGMRTPNQANRASVVEELKAYVNESTSGRTDQIIRMPNLMGDELEEEERRKLSEAGDILSEMLTPEKGPVKE